MRRHLILLTGTALIALVVAACGGGDDAKLNTSATATQQSGAVINSATPEPEDTDTSGDDTTGDGTSDGHVDACKLLTKDEVEAELGKSFQDPDSLYLDPFAECSWDATDFTYSLYLNVYHNTREVIEQFYEFSLTEVLEEVDDVGEKAEFVGDLGRLEVLQGEYYFDIIVSDFDAPDTHRDQTKALARKVVGRLP